MQVLYAYIAHFINLNMQFLHILVAHQKDKEKKAELNALPQCL